MEKKIFGSGIGTKKMVRISMLGLLGFVLLMYNFPLPIFPSFLKLDIANLPGIVAALTMGPLAAAAVEFLKNIIKIIIFTETVGIGEISNFICGTALCVPIGIIYKRMSNVKGFVFGGIIGIIVLTAAASISNYFFIIPSYAVAFGGMEAIIGLASAVNSSVTDLGGMIALAVVPFNILKGVVNVICGYALYKFIKPLFNI